jgi:hypothetical protein
LAAKVGSRTFLNSASDLAHLLGSFSGGKYLRAKGDGDGERHKGDPEDDESDI